MPLLSRPVGKSPRPRRQPAQLPRLAVTGLNVELRMGDTLVTALPEGALWIGEAKTLVVSDLHLEKASAYAVRGQMLPPYDTRAALTKLEALMARLEPDIVVSLGDSFHDGAGVARMSARDRDLLTGMIARCDWIWVEGNHDGRAPETLGGAVREVLHIGALVLRHEPTVGAAPGEIAGHLHP
ncbi:MAG: ligase-associated DNA damage response endonuclease PdeM, partial [Vitreimonas sp.]